MKPSNLRKEIWIYRESVEDITLFNKPDILVTGESEDKIKYVLASEYQEEVDKLKNRIRELKETVLHKYGVDIEEAENE